MAGSKVFPAALMVVLWVGALLVSGIAAAAAQEHASGGSAANSPSKPRRGLGMGGAVGDFGKGLGKEMGTEAASNGLTSVSWANSLSTAGAKTLGWLLPAIVVVILRME